MITAPVARQTRQAIAGELVRVAEAAEAAGATWLSCMDHYFQIDWMAPAEHPMLEGYTALGSWPPTRRWSGSVCSSPG